MKKIIKLESYKGATFFPVFLLNSVLTKEIKISLGKKLTEIFSIIVNDDNGAILAYEDEWNDLCSEAISKIMNEEDFGQKVDDMILDKSKKLKDFSDKLNIEGLSDGELFSLYEEFISLTKDLRAWGWIPNLINLVDNNLLDQTLKRLSDEVPENKINKLFSLLTAPTKRMDFNKADLELMEIIRIIDKSLFEKEINDIKRDIDGKTKKLMKKYLEKYAYLNYYYKGPGMSFDDLIYTIREKIKTIKDIDAKINELKNFSKDIEKEQKEIIKKYRIKEETQRLIREVKRMTFLKAYRKEAMNYSNYKIRVVLDEIAKRLETNYDMVRYLFIEEIRDHLLKNKKIDESKFKNRLKEFIYTCKDGKIFTETNEDKIKIIKDLMFEKEIEENELKGQCAYPGYAKGIVKIVEFKQDMEKFEKGNILVSRSTNPEIVIAMEKAAAIVTDVGGITCHAAIVSRELKKPCVIGTKKASKIFKDGDLIEVDADGGTIKRL